MNEVEELISSLMELKQIDSPLIKNISDYELLLETLKELNNMVEMQKVKSSVVAQIKFLMINTTFEEKNNFDGHMLHTVLSGPPGCGKTRMGVILAKIFTALGLIKGKKVEKGEDFSKKYKIKKELANNLQNHINNIKYDIEDIDVKMNLFKIKSLKRELASKNFSYITCVKLVDDIIKEEERIKDVFNKILFDSNKIKQPIIDFDEILSEIGKKMEKNTDVIKIVSREDFVGGFLGQTAIKTEALLKESLGKVLFIDEAYSLINDEKDSYGYECLNTLNRFMSEHSSEIVVIFAGYQDLLEKTIFKAQPGLKRRCTWNFEIEGYTEKGLTDIFKSQIKKNDWLLEDSVDIGKFFKENIKHFPYFGGDTLRLVFYCKIVYSKEVFDNHYENGKVINEKMLNSALEYLKKEEEEKVYNHMYM